ncbi:hypothetical protein IWZ01DRAFT_66188 [Phyllosticta capitalensis]
MHVKRWKCKRSVAHLPVTSRSTPSHHPHTHSTSRRQSRYPDLLLVDAKRKKRSPLHVSHSSLEEKTCNYPLSKPNFVHHISSPFRVLFRLPFRWSQPLPSQRLLLLHTMCCFPLPAADNRHDQPKIKKKICPQKKQGGKRNDNGRRRQTPDARKMPAPPPPTLSPPSPPPPDHATAVARAKTHGARQPTAKACVFRTWHLRAPCIGSLLGGLSRSLAAFFPGRVLVFWWWWWFPSTYEARVE